MANVLYIPPKIVTGEGALELAASEIKKLGNKCLIVTDDIMVKIGNVKKITDMLDSIDCPYEVYSGINTEPSDEMVADGINIYQEEKCDFFLGIGGGSPIDAMKAIAAVVSNGDTIHDYVGRDLTKPLPPMVAVPTTAGTGSEVTNVSIITNKKTNVKMLLKHPALLPEIAVVDPEFTRTLPPDITASTGVDALTHAVESFTSVKASEMTDTFALSAVKRIFAYIEEAYNNGDNTEARTQMAIASLEAGIAFSNASVTIVHGMSRPIGAMFGVPHGLSNAMLFEKCMQFALPGAYAKFCELAKVVGVYKDGMSDEQGAEAFLDALRNLLNGLNIKTPEQYGIDKEEFFKATDKMSTDALASGSPGNTKRVPTKEEIIEIYKSLF